jgi:hypothetical protein
MLKKEPGESSLHLVTWFQNWHGMEGGVRFWFDPNGKT